MLLGDGRDRATSSNTFSCMYNKKGRIRKKNDIVRKERRKEKVRGAKQSIVLIRNRGSEWREHEERKERNDGANGTEMGSPQ